MINYTCIYGCFHKWGTSKIDGWFHGKSHWDGWFEGTSISGDLHTTYYMRKPMINFDLFPVRLCSEYVDRASCFVWASGRVVRSPQMRQEPFVVSTETIPTYSNYKSSGISIRISLALPGDLSLQRRPTDLLWPPNNHPLSLENTMGNPMEKISRWRWNHPLRSTKHSLMMGRYIPMLLVDSSCSLVASHRIIGFNM